MSKVSNLDHVRVVDLADGVLVRTLIPPQNHPALRSGFAGYPANPRWDVAKFRAWKTGRQWREALHEGEMTVRDSDSMLVSAQEQNEPATPTPPVTKRKSKFGLVKKLLPIA